MQAIVADLEAAGYLTRTRTGRRTRYTVNPDSSFRHPPRKGGASFGIAIYGAIVVAQASLPAWACGSG